MRIIEAVEEGAEFARRPAIPNRRADDESAIFFPHLIAEFIDQIVIDAGAGSAMSACEAIANRLVADEDDIGLDTKSGEFVFDFD